MTRLFPLLLVCAAILVAQGSHGDVPAKDNNPPEAALLVGKWSVEFTNGVKEVCDIFTFDGDGHATVEEPRRRSRGRVVLQDGSVVMIFNDDRVERWTPIGKRFVVEHWFPGSVLPIANPVRLPTATPVLGIAERTP